MRVNNLKELERELMKKINTALDTEVVDTVKDVMIDHIIQDVYDVYNPSMYIRRYTRSGIGNPSDGTDNTGLLDIDNIVATVNGKGELSVQNTTVGSRYFFIGNVCMISENYNKPIAGVIETGKGYDVYNWQYDGVPRPFMENTHDDLQTNHYHTEAMKRSLKQQGLEVK